METPAQMCARLVTALEDLAAQEAVNIQTRDFATVIAVQKRAAPIVDHLAAHGPRIADEKLRNRIAGILARRQASVASLAAEIERTREKLRDLDTRQRRVSQVAPAYTQTLPRRRKLSAIG